MCENASVILSVPSTLINLPEKQRLSPAAEQGSSLSWMEVWWESEQINLSLSPSTIELLLSLEAIDMNLPNSATKLLQHIQNAAALLVYNLPKFSHVTSLLRDLHWLPFAARIWLKAMVLAFKAGRPHASARALRSSTSAGWLVPPALRVNKACSGKSRLFSVLAPQW